MNFAIPFMRNFKYKDQDIQWNINYKPKIKQLDDFITTYGSHRINLIIEDFNLKRENEILQALYKKFPQTELILCLPQYTKELEQILNNNNLPHYYSNFVTDYDTFNGFLKLNVTDIFVANNLMFNVPFLSQKAKEAGKALRSYCNICESAWKDTPSIKTFFIRPEDIDLYQKYIDTFEFYVKNLSSERVNTLYKIYTKDKKWLGQLNELIIGFYGDVDNRYIAPRFGIHRLNCNKKCFNKQEPVCNLCDNIIQLSEIFKKINLIVVKKKQEKKDEEPEESAD